VLDIKKNAIITITGRPNVGKSTLLNRLTGEKIAAVTNKPQTTRSRIFGVVNRGDTQLVFADTPGYHKPHTKLGEQMVVTVRESIADVDAILLIAAPVASVGAAERELIQLTRRSGIPCVLAINKIDTVEPKDLLGIIAVYGEAFDFASIVPISAKYGSGMDELISELMKYACDGPALYPEGVLTDQPESAIIAEIIREKLLICLDKEIPHGTAVEITRFSERGSEEAPIIDVEATIFCEKQSHKGIIIGQSGTMLKKIGTMARVDAERFMGAKVNLQTWVKVKENWRNNPRQLSALN